MPSKTKRRATNINGDLAAIVDILAAKSHRSFSGQVNALIESAIALITGEKEQPLKEIETALYSLSTIELVRLIKIVGDLLEEKLKKSTPPNTLAQLIKENYALCMEAFEDDLEELEALINGEQPSMEAEQLLIACLPLSPEETTRLIQQEFYTLCNTNAELPAVEVV